MFYGIPTFVGYLMPNAVYTYILSENCYQTLIILFGINNFGCDFSDSCPHLYCGKLNVSATVSSGLPQVSLVYLGIGMIQPEEGRRIQRRKCCVSTYNNKDEDNSPKNHDQNNTHQATSKKFGQINNLLVYN